ncbi:MAG: hypothetical protein KTQ49_05370 [Candidatus Omnitrophica bacterium]|nr:hypothetical protein [Candidatus Omnitrophota bacterium]
MKNSSAQDPPYDAWLNWFLPGACNLRCEYCIVHPSDPKKRGLLSSAAHSLVRFRRKHFSIQGFLLYAVESLFQRQDTPSVNIPALLDSLDRTHMIFRINFTGKGEPFLVPNIVEACEQLTRIHYVSFNTNLIPQKIGDFCDRIDPERVASIQASLHIKELEKRGLFDVFIDHFLKLREKKFPIAAIEVAYPGLFPEIEKYRSFFAERGIPLRFGWFNGVYRGKEYPAAYTREELNGFGLKGSPGLETFQQGTLCNAGYNTASIRESGAVVICNDVIEPLGHIYKGFRFKKKPIQCPAAFCSCSLKYYDAALYRKALVENKVSRS